MPIPFSVERPSPDARSDGLASRAGRVYARAPMRGLRTILFLVYLVIGFVVAANRDYLDSLDSLREIISAILAVVLWPLVLLGVNLNIRG
jgi:hypothetical protein